MLDKSGFTLFYSLLTVRRKIATGICLGVLCVTHTEMELPAICGLPGNVNTVFLFVFY